MNKNKGPTLLEQKREALTRFTQAIMWVCLWYPLRRGGTRSHGSTWQADLTLTEELERLPRGGIRERKGQGREREFEVHHGRRFCVLEEALG